MSLEYEPASESPRAVPRRLNLEARDQGLGFPLLLELTEVPLLF